MTAFRVALGERGETSLALWSGTTDCSASATHAAKPLARSSFALCRAVTFAACLVCCSVAPHALRGQDLRIPPRFMGFTLGSVRRLDSSYPWCLQSPIGLSSVSCSVGDSLTLYFRNDTLVQVFFLAGLEQVARRPVTVAQWWRKELGLRVGAFLGPPDSLHIYPRFLRAVWHYNDLLSDWQASVAIFGGPKRVDPLAAMVVLECRSAYTPIQCPRDH